MANKSITFLFIILLFASCSKQESPSITAHGLTITAYSEQPALLSKTILNGPSVEWSVSDQIALYDESGNNAIYQSTDHGDVCSFEYVSGSLSLSGKVYAYYPAQNVISFDCENHSFKSIVPPFQDYTYNNVIGSNMPMTACGVIDNQNLTLSFKNAFSILHLSLTGDGEIAYELIIGSQHSLCGEATIIIDDQGVPSTTIIGYNSITLSRCNCQLSAIPTDFYCLVPSSHSADYQLTVNYSTGSVSKTKRKPTKVPIEIKRGNIYHFQPTSLSGFEEISLIQPAANCYMVDASKISSIIIPLSQVINGWSKVAELGEDSQIASVSTKIKGTLSAETFWKGEQGSQSIIISAESLLSSENDVLSLSFIDCINGTNAVVDIKSGTDILWSWHIWFTNYAPTKSSIDTKNGQVHDYRTKAFLKGGSYYGKVMMDRNLGATYIQTDEKTITQPTSDIVAESLFGFDYQFGRKDFVFSSSSTKSASYSDAINTPHIRYGGDNTWNTTDQIALAVGIENDVWGGNGNKTAFDPCPYGWRVPTATVSVLNNVWTGVVTEYRGNYGSSKKTGGRLIKVNGNIIGWYPSQSGSYGYYWSSTPSSALSARIMVFNDGSWNDSFKINRKSSWRIRCVSE